MLLSNLNKQKMSKQTNEKRKISICFLLMFDIFLAQKKKCPSKLVVYD